MMPSKILSLFSPLNSASRPDGCGEIHLYQSCSLSYGLKSSLSSMRGKVQFLLHGPGLHQSAMTVYSRTNVISLNIIEVQVQNNVDLLLLEVIFNCVKSKYTNSGTALQYSNFSPLHVSGNCSYLKQVKIPTLKCCCVNASILNQSVKGIARL